MCGRRGRGGRTRVFIQSKTNGPLDRPRLTGVVLPCKREGLIFNDTPVYYVKNVAPHKDTG